MIVLPFINSHRFLHFKKVGRELFLKCTMWRKTKLISKFAYKELEPFMVWLIDLGLSTAVLKYLRFNVHAEICFLLQKQDID
jgi:hypothetical protein